MKLFIAPEDVWLFRDGRSFSAGSDHRAQSLFPPMPTTVQGMLRSNHLVIKQVDLSSRRDIVACVGTANTYPTGFRLRGPILAKYACNTITRYYPLPEDAHTPDRSRPALFQALTPVDPPAGVQTSCPLPKLLWDSGQPSKRVGRWWLTEDQLIKYLRGGTAQATKEECLFGKDARFGIAQNDDTHTTEEGMLYEIEFVRPRDNYGFYVEIDGLGGWPKAGLLRAGGQSKAGRYQQLVSQPIPAPPSPLPARFKLYFATPTYLDQGWQTRDWARFFDGPVNLVCAAVGRYQSLGGFDMTANAESAGAMKAARRLVPAGSVYFFESDGQVSLRDEPIAADDKTRQRTGLCDDPAPIGWGQVLVGSW